MIILDWRAGAPEQPYRHIALIFGVGLIGSAILSAIAARVGTHRQDLAFTWRPGGDRNREADAIVSHVSDRLRIHPGERPRVDIVWSAGRTGFASLESDCTAEEPALAGVLDLAERLHGIADISRFHLVSSAGGLFEGQRHVDASILPAPLRPYGLAKLKQEQRVRALPRAIGTSIYRPSSVYGYARRGGRIGLIAALIQNAIRFRTTRIYGDLNTIRDHVFVDDVGGFIADRVIGAPGGAEMFLLASGKPTSTRELTSIVQNTLQRELYLQYEPKPSNALDNSFRPSGLPSGWRATPLMIGVERTAARIMASYRVSAR